MFKSSINYQNLLGILACLLLALPGAACNTQPENSFRQRSRSLKLRIHAQRDTGPPAQKVLQKLCEENSRQTGNPSFTGEDLNNGDKLAWEHVSLGIENARKHLSLVKDLTITAFHEHATDFQLDASDLKQIEKYVRAINSIELDESLANAAEVDDENPQKIRVGPEYALNLTIDEETILLLGHELTHVAAWSERLSPFIESSAQKARQVAGVSPTEDQKEDLACDYIGALALKEFIRLRPTNALASERFSIPLSGCEAEEGDSTGDEDHLSEGDTLRALLALDPELEEMILQN